MRVEVPQPLCLALAEMRQPPRWQLVFLVPNLDSFQHYIAYYATEAEIEELLHLPVVYHRGTWSGNATPFPIGVMVGDRFVQFPETLCTAAACWLCQEGRSGYSFCWVDELWTPQAAIDLMLSLQEMRGARKPWPCGILQEPQPAVVQALFLSSERDVPPGVWER